jgi:hypothetical protein
MAIYDELRTKIESNGGLSGSIGSYNPTGGTALKIKYDTGNGVETHHVIPFLIGTSPDKTSTDPNPPVVQMFLAYKYKGPSTHPGTGFRCYRVDKITSLPTGAPDTPPTGKKVKFKRQNCVTDWE